MPHYRLHIKLEGQEVKEFTIEDHRINIDFVYLDYKRRVNAKNGTARVIYFDLVMIAEASLAYQGDREEVYNSENNYLIELQKKIENPPKKQRRSYVSGPTLGERIRK